MSKTRIYAVRDRDTGTIRLVEACTAAAARHHVTASRFDVDAASALDVARLMGETTADELATLKLGAINERLAPIALTEAGIRSLGIEPAGRGKRAVLYSESQFAEICQVLVLHLQSVVQLSEATA